MAISQATADELKGLIHHSDRGVQYCCNDYTDELKKYHMKTSMTEDYKPTDNAIAERVNGILKTEVIYREKRFKTYLDALERISGFITFQIYIPNLIRKWYTLGIQKLDESEKYLLGLVLRNIDDSKDVGGGIEIMEDYVDEAQEVSLDDDLRESYDKEWALKDLGLQQGILEGYERGQVEGHELGLKDGIEQGKKEGLEIGKKEGLEIGKKELAVSLIKNGVSLELISKSSDYSVEDLKKIMEEI